MRIIFICAALATIALSPVSGAGARGNQRIIDSCRARRGKPQPDLFTIHEVNVSNGSFTVQSGGGFTTMTVRPDTEVTINGVEAAFKDLRPQMKARVTLAEPGVAALIEATGGQGPPNYSGNPPPGVGGSPAPAGGLAQALIGTKWKWGKNAITFNQDSATFPGWTADWKITGPHEVTLTMVTPRSRAGQVAVFDFDADLKTLSAHDFGGRPVTSHRLN